MSDCTICELYSLIDGWESEASDPRYQNPDPENKATGETLNECAEELAAKLPPRGHAFH